jgi:hypothetical protein
MAHIGRLPPPYRIPPSRPGAGTGESGQAPERKPDSGDGEADKRRQQKDHGDDAAHIDEYA